LGRTRILDHAVLDAKAAGWAVLRARPTPATARASSMAESLGNQLVQALGNHALEVARTMGFYATLFDLTGVSAGRAAADDEGAVLPRLTDFVDGAAGTRQQEAFVRWLFEVSRTHPVFIAVDDAHRFPEGPTALLAAFADDARARRLMMLLSAESSAVS